mmetsp:Transcript_76467/g.216177  ORF Transcript_76467/g.216177 Transcript_76467/m.216177 type:complete len:257 (+) Transcript_76467:64-834(+)
MASCTSQVHACARAPPCGAPKRRRLRDLLDHRHACRRLRRGPHHVPLVHGLADEAHDLLRAAAPVHRRRSDRDRVGPVPPLAPVGRDERGTEAVPRAALPQPRSEHGVPDLAPLAALQHRAGHHGDDGHAYADQQQEGEMPVQLHEAVVDQGHLQQVDEAPGQEAYALDPAHVQHPEVVRVELRDVAEQEGPEGREEGHGEDLQPQVRDQLEAVQGDPQDVRDLQRPDVAEVPDGGRDEGDRQEPHGDDEGDDRVD